jgi:hypothetical protein
MFASKNLMFGQQSGGYQISRSVRLRSSASAYFNRTIGTPTNNKICTFSFWAKRGALQSAGSMGIIGTSGGDYIDFNNDNMEIRQLSGGGGRKITTAVFRDPSAWYHFVFQLDTTDATAANRIKIWQNGVQLTSFSTSTDPSQNSTWSFNVASAAVRLATDFSSYFDGYLTEMYFIDGQALTPTSFGAFDAVTGVWNPKAYSGTYGTNGFYLNFKDPTSTTTIGYDYSGNSNNWTANNISVTAGVTYDSMVDSPTNYGIDTGVGGTVRGNYATLNPLANGTAAYVKDANLRINPSDGNFQPSFSTIGVSSGKWYAECTVTNVGTGFVVGIDKLPSTLVATQSVGQTSTSWGWYGDGTNNRLYNNNSYVTTYGTAYTTGVVIGIALDMDAGTLLFYRNGTSQGTAVTGLSGTYAIGASPAGSAGIADMNYGQRAFAYTAPSGYKALCTQNLPTATISNGANYMAASLYTGTGASQTVSNAVNSISFQPDMVWIKSRSAVTDHKWTDSVRGTTKALISNSTAAETTDSTGLTAFGSSSFTVGANTTYNNSGATYVGWQWKGGGTAASNTNGSITSSVSANPTAGFSVVAYTGSGSNATVGHGLGVAPNMVITRPRASADGWVTYHTSLTSGAYILSLQSQNGESSSPTVYNSMTTRNSTVFSVGTDTSTNTSSATYISYCFAAISGFSAFGSYTGNGSTDGPFIYCGFRPRWVMVKKTTASGRWAMADSSRSPYNVGSQMLYADASNAEDTGSGFTYDLLSNGFKPRDSDGNWNASTQNYIFVAFAENPFTLARAR